MRTDDAQAITERAEDLAQHEQARRGHPSQVRVRMLRLLTGGTATSLPLGAPLVGDSRRHLGRWWARDTVQGVTGLLADTPRRGTTPTVTPAASTALEEQLRAGRVARLEDARRSLAEQWGIPDGSVSGVWWPVRTRTAKPTTGRRRHQQADRAAQEAFTKGGCAST